MIRSTGEGIHSTSDNFSVSLREFPKGSTISSKVKKIPYQLVCYWLLDFEKKNHQRPTNISIKIDTTKELTTDFGRDHDPEKLESALVSAHF